MFRSAVDVEQASISLMNRYQRNTSIAALRPSQINGYVYYARLKTSLGYFYKLGFTTLDSVQQRFAYQGKGDEELLDSVLCFAYLEDAFDVEVSLHAHFIARAAFSAYCADPDMPLYGNGQSELYLDDILGLDEEYNDAQSHHTRNNIRLAGLERSLKAVGETRRKAVVDPDAEALLKALQGPVGWLMRLYGRVLWVFASEREKVAHAAREGRHYRAKVTKSPHIDAIVARLKDVECERQAEMQKKRVERQRRINQMMREAGIEPVQRT